MTTNIMYSSLILAFLFSYGLFKKYEIIPIEEHKIEEKDIDQLLGEWSGTLTYLDYKSKQSYSMPCELQVSVKGRNKKLILKYNYPNEPKANGKEKIKISNDGSMLNGIKIASRLIDSDGDVVLFTENLGKDGNEGRNALIKNIYKIGTKRFIIRKEVKFAGSDEWILRNEYSFKRK